MSALAPALSLTIAKRILTRGLDLPCHLEMRLAEDTEKCGVRLCGDTIGKVGFCLFFIDDEITGI